MSDRHVCWDPKPSAGRPGSLARFIAAGSLAFVIGGCSAAPTATPTQPVVQVVTVIATDTPSPTATATASATPTLPPTNTPKPRPTATRHLTPTATPPPTVTPGPSPTLGPDALCQSLIAQHANQIVVVYLHPTPELIWDTGPRMFNVGLCDAIPPPSVPQGKYRIVISFPHSNRGQTESAPVQGELHPGMNEVSVGPWVPGIEVHLAICAPLSPADAHVTYNDTGDRFYRALPWPDGSDHTSIIIKCGGSYP